MKQEILKEIEKLKNTHFKKIYKTKKLTINQHTKSGNIYINLEICFDLSDYTTGLYFNIYLNGEEIENFSKKFRQYHEALLMFQKIKKMIKTFISNL